MTNIFEPDDDLTSLNDVESTQGRRARSRLLFTLVIFGALITAILVVIALVGGLYINGLARSFDEDTTKIPNALPSQHPAPDSDTNAVNILLMGSDSRGAATTINGNAATNQRTDTMMLLHVDADRRAVYVMSIMRDLWVPIPNHGTHKINAAYAYGGSALTLQTVEQLLGIHIDHVAIIDFQGFKGMTDALGGVDVSVKQPFTARGSTFSAGVNHLDGDDALKFVRERYAFTNGDYQRVANQQQFMRAIIQKVASRGTLTSPSKLSKFVRATSSYLSVDDTFDSQEIANLVLSLRHLGTEGTHFFTIPTSGTGTADDGESVVLVDGASMPALRMALSTDSLATFRPE